MDPSNFNVCLGFPATPNPNQARFSGARRTLDMNIKLPLKKCPSVLPFLTNIEEP